MTEESQQTHIKLLQQLPPDSMQFKIELNERAIKWLKDQNHRHVQKINRLEKIILQKEQEIKLLHNELNFAKIQIQGMTKKLQIRTHRFEQQQRNYLSKTQQQQLIRCLEQAQAKLLFSNQQMSVIRKQNHDLLVQVQQLNKQKLQLNNEIDALNHREHQYGKDMQSLQKLYKEKLQFLSNENEQLKKHIQSLLLQLQLNQKKKQIDGLLTYQNHLNHQGFFRHYKEGRNISDLAVEINDDEKLQTFRQNQCCLCLQLQEQLIQRQQLFELMKQRNLRLQKEVQSFKKRCINLQNIICCQKLT